MSLLRVEKLKKSYRVKNRLFSTATDFEAIKNINLELEEGKTLAIVGESGSGKSTLARQIIGIEKPTDGAIYFQEELQDPENNKQRIQRFRNIRMVFQNPYESLNPQARIGETLDQVLQINTQLNLKERKAKIAKTLQKVGLLTEHQYRYPHMFSGGQRQRIAIARAIILEPKIIIADEPLSALDVSIQAQILNLLQELQEEMKISYIFISHDLNIVEHIADTVMVMYRGEVVEYGSVAQIFDQPLHPYTQTLFASTPMYRARFPEFVNTKLVRAELEVTQHCGFAARCEFASERCNTQSPSIKSLNDGHLIACFKVT